MKITLEYENKIEGIALERYGEIDGEVVFPFFCSLISVVKVYGSAHITIDNGEPVKYILKKETA